MATPYITPNHLTMLPTGYPWTQLPGSSSGTADAFQAQMLLCREASGWVDGYCNQTLRCTSNYETLPAPGPQVSASYSGVVSIWPTRQPILSVTSIEVRPVTATEADWTTLESDYYWTLAVPGLMEFGAGDGTREIQVLGTGITRWTPNGDFLLRVTYLNGWAHGGLTAAGTVGATTLAVDSVLGFSVGDQPRVDDGTSSETVTVSAITTNSDGVTGSLTIASPGLVYAHGAGVPVTEMPEVVVTDTGYYAATLAYRRGAVSLAVPPMGPTGQTNKASSTPDWEKKIRADLMPFRRDY